ncbi:MAG: hypothetical protein A3F17_04010 [Gammaproteobacteria bacterium RIFCSPHIGHO2_12_FULL_41_15]|nr:MAG: hypothetical protein A3F17_04010 [Gammaproteobacteria bacterium RIFCSPHIGHO2_12_FULL_41_15]
MDDSDLGSSPSSNPLPPRSSNPTHQFIKSQVPKIWKARIVVAIIMLVFAFLGLIINDFLPTGQWFYWRVLSPCYAIISVWLTWYVDRSKGTLSGKNVGLQIVLWLGLMASILIMTVYVDSGIMGRIEGGFAVLVLVAMTTFAAGLFFDTSLTIVGIILGLFAVGAGLIQAYLSVIAIPIVIIGAVIVVIIARRGRNG